MKSPYKCKCPVCEKEVACRASGGDWLNSIYPVFHKHNGKTCEGMWHSLRTIIDTRNGKEVPA